MSHVEIRATLATDLPAIAAILESLGYPQTSHEALARTFNDIASRKDMGALVACVDGNVAGLLTYSFKPQLRFSGHTTFEIDELGVLPNARGAGIGKLLLARAREIAVASGANRIVLVTSRARESYQRGFYLKNGFEEANSAYMRLELR